jgi:hypothetical protein
MLTVIETCRRQGPNGFAWLLEAVQAHLHGEAALVAAAGGSDGVEANYRKN